MYAKALSCRDDSKLVQLVYKMMKLCEQSDEAYVQNMSSESIGIHPANRSGKQMNAAKMHKKGFKIHKVGFASVLCTKEKAVAFEDHPPKKLCEQHTLQCTDASKSFGQYSPGTIRAGSCGCSHLNQWIHAGNNGAETPYKELCESGKSTMSKATMCHDNDELLRAMDDGLQWTVIK